MLNNFKTPDHADGCSCGEENQNPVRPLAPGRYTLKLITPDGRYMVQIPATLSMVQLCFSAVALGVDVREANSHKAMRALVECLASWFIVMAAQGEVELNQFCERNGLTLTDDTRFPELKGTDAPQT